MTAIERSPRQLIEFFYLLTRMELKARYKGRLLGYLWAVGATLALAFVYWIVFKIIMRIEMDNYSVYLVAGLFPWTALSVSVALATRSFVANAPLVKEAGLSPAVLPLGNVLGETAHLAFALPVAIAWIVLAGGYPVSSSWIWQVPLMLALQAAFIYPVALACALTNAFIRDLDYLLGIALPVLFFVTPMVYPIAMVPEPLTPYFELNPLHALMQSWRAVLLEHALDLPRLAYAAGFALAAGALAWLLHRRLAHRISEVV